LEDRTYGCFLQIPYPVFSFTLLRPITPLSAPLPTVLSLLSWCHPFPLPAKNPHRKLAYSYMAPLPSSPFLDSPWDHLACFTLLLGAFIPGCYKKQLITSSRLSHLTNDSPLSFPLDSPICHPITFLPYSPTHYSL
jgi:hypothetical protein